MDDAPPKIRVIDNTATGRAQIGYFISVGTDYPEVRNSFSAVEIPGVRP